MKLAVNAAAIAASTLGCVVMLLGCVALPAQTGQVPSAPTPTAPAQPVLTGLDPFPTINPKYFTADSPTPATVNAFLKQLWGYDPDRLWSVQAIMKTPAPGVSRVVIDVTERGANEKVQQSSFFVTPDGKHAISANDIITFGPTPFADNRKMLQEHADGPARGSASKDFMLVEFVDMQCPHCKAQQPTMDNLVKDFPNARVVTQNFPLVDIHPSAYKAAAYGVCVAKKNNDAFFVYEKAVFDNQDALTPDGTDQALAAAVTKAGMDPASIATCADSAATKATVDAQLKLAHDLNVGETPMLSINGRMLPLAAVNYETLKQIIDYQALQDGVNTGHIAGPTLMPMPPPSQ